MTGPGATQKVTSYIYGAEEFVFLLRHALINYGGLIGGNMVRGTFSSSHYTVRQEETTLDPQAQSGFNEQGYKIPTNSEVFSEKENPPPSQQPERPEYVSTGRGASQRHRGASATTTQPSAQNEEQLREQELAEQISRMRLDLEHNDTVLDWSDVAGLNSCKSALDEFASFFLHFPHLTRNLRNRSTAGILLFGPQGTGKTLLVKSFAKKYNLTLYDIRASAIMSKFVGEAEKFVKAMFKEVRQNAPALLLLDECDGLLCNPNADASQSHSYRLLQNEIKNQWSDLMYSRDEVIVVGVTNKPHDIDMDGFGRRLSLKLLVDLPSAKSCQQILKLGLDRLRHVVTDEQIEGLAAICHDRGFSGFDVDTLVEGQLRRVLRAIVLATHFKELEWDGKQIFVPCGAEEDGSMAGKWTSIAPDPEMVSYRPLNFEDMRGAVLRTRPTVDAGMIQRHVEFASLYGTEMD